MDDALVEKVARAMYEAHVTRNKPWEVESLFQRKRWLASARAAMAIPDLRLVGVKEGLEMAAVCAEKSITQFTGKEADGFYYACDKISASIRSLGPRP